MDLITGATGIVGTHMLLESAAHGPVRALYREGSDRSIVERVFRHYLPDPSGSLSQIEWFEADLLDVDALHRSMDGVQRVYHTAALVSFDPKDARRMETVNVTGTANVVNAALANGIERMCHVSSIATIGKAPEGVQRHEALPWEQDEHTSVYALSKYDAELEVYRGIAEGLDAFMVNPCVILGPGAIGRSSMTLMERLKKGTRFFPPGTNAVVDVRDVASCMRQLMEKSACGERYILAGENLSYQQLFTLASAAFGNAAPTVRIAPWVLDVAWRAERVRSLLSGARPFVTKDTVHSSVISRSYSSVKVLNELGCEFKTTKEAVENVALYLGRN